jgi:hypothetical protein
MVATIEENKRGQMGGTTSYERETQPFPSSVQPVTEQTPVQETPALSAREPLSSLTLIVTGATIGSIAGLSSLVLGIVGLSSVLPMHMLGVSGIVLGAAFLMLGIVDIVWARMFRFTEPNESWSRGLLFTDATVLLIAGIVAIVFSGLNLMFLTAERFSAAAIIVMGLGLLWHSRTMRRVSRFTHDSLEGRRLSGPVAINALSLATVRDFVLGLTGVILGILAIFSVAPITLGLVMQLVFGVALTLTVSTICGATLATLRAACSKSH